TDSRIIGYTLSVASFRASCRLSASSRRRFFRIVSRKTCPNHGSRSSSENASARMAVQTGSGVRESGVAADMGGSRLSWQRGQTAGTQCRPVEPPEGWNDGCDGSSNRVDIPLPPVNISRDLYGRRDRNQPKLAQPLVVRSGTTRVS